MSRKANSVGATVLATEVLLRYFSGNSGAGSHEIIELLMIIVAFIAVASPAVERRHIAVEYKEA